MLIGRVLVDGIATWVSFRDGITTAIDDPFDPRGGDVVGARVTGEILTPVDPTVIVGIAQNGPGHPAPVQAWLKNPRTIIAANTAVTLRRDAGVAVAEAEIAVVLSRDAQGLTAADAHEYVLGVTAVNDLSSPDRTQHDPRNFEGKSGIGYTPLGPWIDTEASIDDVAVSLDIDGRTVAHDEAGALPVSIRDALAYVARWAPLGAGDVVMTGAPRTAHLVSPGERMGVRVGAVLLETPTR